MKTPKELCDISNDIDARIEPYMKNIYNYLEDAAKYGENEVDIKQTTMSNALANTMGYTWPPIVGAFLLTKEEDYIIQRLKSEGFKVEPYEYDGPDYISNYKKFLGCLFEYGEPRYGTKKYKGVKISFCCGEENE